MNKISLRIINVLVLLLLLISTNHSFISVPHQFENSFGSFTLEHFDKKHKHKTPQTQTKHKIGFIIPMF